MRKLITLSTLLFLFCTVFLSLGTAWSYFGGLPEMKAALAGETKYVIKSKGGSREFEGEKLRRLIFRVSMFTKVFGVLIPVIFLCVLGTMKKEFIFALVGGAAVLGAHLTGLILVGWNDYSLMSARSGAISMAFMMSILGVMPAAYVLYMRHSKMKFHPDAPKEQ